MKSIVQLWVFTIETLEWNENPDTPSHIESNKLSSSAFFQLGHSDEDINEGEVYVSLWALAGHKWRR